MDKKLLYIALVILLIAFSFSAGYFLKPAAKTAIPNNVTTPEKEPLAFFTTVDTPKGTLYIYVNQDYIDLNAAETPDYEKAPTINKEKYPKLFKQGVANYSALRIEYYKQSKDGETYIKLSNIQPDHGGFADTYAILVDPFTGIVIESKTIDYYSGEASFK